MGKRKAGAGAAGESPALFADPSRRRGRVERAVDAAIREGRRTDAVTRLDDGTAALARELARAVDYAGTTKRDPYGVAAASRELREVLGRLGLDPAARGNAARADGIAELLADLGTPDETPQGAA